MDRDKLKEVLDIGLDGLYWKKSGRRVGCLCKNTGYRRFTLKGTSQLEHRVLFFLYYGHWPETVDHINGVRDDNRLENLREADNTQQHYNQRTRKDSKSGIKGVYWWEARQKWRAHITYNGIWKTIGYYDTKEEAENAVIEAREKYHKEFARI